MIGIHPSNINSKKVSDKQFATMVQQLREKLVVSEVVAVLWYLITNNITIPINNTKINNNAKINTFHSVECTNIFNSGLDFSRDIGLRVPQEKFLREELKLAGELDLPVVSTVEL